MQAILYLNPHKGATTHRLRTAGLGLSFPSVALCLFLNKNHSRVYLRVLHPAFYDISGKLGC